MTENHLKLAFQALLNGDTAERDRQCELAKAEIARNEANEARLRTLKSTDHLKAQ